MKLLNLLTSLFMLSTISSTQLVPENCKGDELILKHLVRLSDGNKAKPKLVILLHGVGSNEQDMFYFAKYFPSEFIVISARAPFEIDPSSYTWFHVQFLPNKRVINKEEAEKSRIILKQFINQAVERYHADHSNVFLIGFSQGAIMSYSVGLTAPEKVNGIAAIGGRILEEVKPLVKQSEYLTKLNVMIAHGMQDETMPIHYANEASEYITSLGIKLKFNKYPLQHTVTEEQIQDVIKWIGQLP